MTEEERSFLHHLDQRIETLRHLNHELKHLLGALVMIPTQFTSAVATLNAAIATIPAPTPADPNAITDADGEAMTQAVSDAAAAVTAKVTPVVPVAAP